MKITHITFRVENLKRKLEIEDGEFFGLISFRISNVIKFNDLIVVRRPTSDLRLALGIPENFKSDERNRTPLFEFVDERVGDAILIKIESELRKKAHRKILKIGSLKIKTTGVFA